MKRTFHNYVLHYPFFTHVSGQKLALECWNTVLSTGNRNSYSLKAESPEVASPAPGKGLKHMRVMRRRACPSGEVKTTTGTPFSCPLSMQSSDLKQNELQTPADCHNFTDAFWCSTVLSCPTELPSSCSFSLKHFTITVYSAFHQRIMSCFAITDYTCQPYMKNNPSPKS